MKSVFLSRPRSSGEAVSSESRSITSSGISASEREEYRLKKAACEERMQHAESRWIFWVNRWIETGNHNGELAQAFAEYQEAEKEKKELEREIVVKFEQHKN